jgi:tripartite ATP-independent transporter DctP family solute receptor
VKLNRFWGALASALLLGALTTSPASAQVKAKLGTSLPDTHPQTIGARKFAELVGTRTEGRVTVTVYSNATLGSDVQMTSALQGGTLDFTVPSTATLANLVKDFGVIGLPFSFTSEKQADAVLDGPFGQALLAKLPEKKLIGLAFWENGFRNVTNSRRSIEKVDDFSGIKIRTMQNNLYIDMFNGLGSNAVPMAVNELFTALETRAVDAQENPFTVIHAQKFFDVQKYLSTTGHAYDALVLLAGKPFWDKLSEADRGAIEAAAKEATLFQRETSRRLNGDLKAALAKEGMQITEVTPEQRGLMREKLKPVINKYAAQFGDELVSSFYGAIAKANSGN